MSSVFERRLQVLREIQDARIRLADAHIALHGRQPDLDEQFKLEALEMHLRELGELMDELSATDDGGIGQKRERITIQQVDDSGVWSDVATVWASVEILTTSTDQSGQKQIAEAFTHSDDYRTVKLGNDAFTLTSREAQVIEILHEAHKQSTPEVSAEYILDRIGSGKRVRDIFATRRRQIFKRLVRAGKRKGTFRLNLG